MKVIFGAKSHVQGQRPWSQVESGRGVCGDSEYLRALHSKALGFALTSLTLHPISLSHTHTDADC